MVLSCSVEDSGNPKSTRFHWLRGDEHVKDIIMADWPIDPVGLHSRNNYSCFAFNDGGNGTLATIYVDVQVAPKFISKLLPYSGFLYSDTKVNLSCRVECVPDCNIYWFRDGLGIDRNNERYFINQTSLPADTSTGDFESVLSELVISFDIITNSSQIDTQFKFRFIRQHFNISAWPDHRLDSLKDSANYTCSSSNNSVGMGVRSATSFGVECKIKTFIFPFLPLLHFYVINLNLKFLVLTTDPPENVTITPQEVQVVEGKTPPRLVCSASAHPSKFHYFIARVDSINLIK